jgi:molybdate transport system substrate-binding protein
MTAPRTAPRPPSPNRPWKATSPCFAAASLTDAFDEVGTAFEDDNPDVNIEFNYGPSSGLREQIIAGAPADVFASANTSNMDQVVKPAPPTPRKTSPPTSCRSSFPPTTPATSPASRTSPTPTC